MICSDIWHKYHSGYFKIVSNFTRLTAREITYNNFEISLVVFMPNITTNHTITYTNLEFQCLEKPEFKILAFSKHCNSKFGLFPNIAILNFAFILNLGLFQTLKFYISPFFKHSNSKFPLFPNIGILNFLFSKHWNSKY